MQPGQPAQREKLEREKLQLEARQIEADLAERKDKAGTELDKLRLEVRQIEADLAERKDRRAYENRNNWWAWLRYTLTIVIALAVPVLGWYFTEKGRAANERLTISQRDEELYYRILQGFGSTSSAARQGAAAALASYAKVGLHSGEHARETSALLANRLTSETDNGVLDEVINGLGSLPPSSIPETVRANRIASLQYARALGRVVALRYIAAGFARNDPVAVGRGTRTLRGAVYAEVSGTATPLEREPINPNSTLDLAHLTLDARIGAAYESELADLLANGTLTRKNAGEDAPRALRLLEDGVRNLAATSAALVRLMRTNTGSLQNEDFRDVVILDGDLHGLDLRYVDLTGSNLQGSAVGTDFSFSSLAGASLVKLVMTDALGAQARIRAADITGTVFSSSDPLPDLTGSFWWRARRDISTDAQERKTAPLSGLDSKYPRNTAIHDCIGLRGAAHLPLQQCNLNK